MVAILMPQRLRRIFKDHATYSFQLKVAQRCGIKCTRAFFPFNVPEQMEVSPLQAFATRRSIRLVRAFAKPDEKPTCHKQTNKLCGKMMCRQQAVQNCNADAGPDQWSQLIGVPAFPDLDLSLIVLAEPNFDQLGDLLAGLDYAFPDAAKIGVCRPDVGPWCVARSGHVMVWGCVYP